MKEKLADTVYNKIRDAIMTGELTSSDMIQEQAVADQYHISKITAREVLQRLCHDKYLKSFPRKGYLLLDITPAQSRMLQQVRYQVEALALRLIVRTASDEEIDQLAAILAEQQTGSRHDPYATVNSRFHLQIGRMSKNPYLYDSMYSFLGLISRYAITVGQGQISENPVHHLELVDALRRRDEAAALEELRLDLQLEKSEV